MKRIKESSYAAALDRAVGDILSRKVDLSVRHVLIVPDVYTFTLEKRLFSAGNGAFDLEVTTFNRIYKRIMPSVKVLPRTGAVMLLKRIARKNKDKLSCYSKAYARTGFADKLYNAIGEFRACELTPDDIAAAKDVKKTDDLALLYREYLAATDGKYVDAAGRKKALIESVALREYLCSAHVYVALFDTFSKETERLLSVFDEATLSLSVYESATSSVKPLRNVEAFECQSRVDCYKQAAKAIKSYAVSHGENSLDDVCVVALASDYDVAARVFREVGLPLFVDEKISLGDSELASFIFTALACAGRYRRQDMTALAMNFYSGIERRDAEHFCDFVTARRIDYRGFLCEFVCDDEDERERVAAAERARERLIKIVGKVGKYDSALSLSRAIGDLLEFVNAREATRKLSALDGRDLMQIYDKAKETVALFADTMSDNPDDGDFLEETLKEGFAGTEISLVPNERYAINIGELSAFRGRRVGFGVIPCFNEGEIPAVFDDNALISDAEAERLAQQGISLAPRSSQKNELCRDELVQFLLCADKLLLCYDGSKKPSYELKRILAASGKNIKNASLERESLETLSNEDAARVLGSKSLAYEFAATARVAPDYRNILAAIGEEEESSSEEQPLSCAAKLFGKKKTSVSALQSYFQCPHRYFFEYGLRIKKKDDGHVRSFDIGRIFHYVVEKFVDADMPENHNAFAREKINEYLELEHYGNKVSEHEFERIASETSVLLQKIEKQIKAGVFVPIATEKSFGKDDPELKPISLGSISLLGEIDRIDKCGNAVRVIDYKTGNSDFLPEYLYYGKKLQLAAYMQVMIENGYEPAGFFYFPLKAKWTDDEYSHVLNGAVCGENGIIEKMDESMLAPKKSEVLNLKLVQKKGEPVARFEAKKGLVICSDAQLRAICAYVKKVASAAVEDFMSGYIARSPLPGACSYCDYAAACRGEQSERVTAKGISVETLVSAAKEE